MPEKPNDLPRRKDRLTLPGSDCLAAQPDLLLDDLTWVPRGGESEFPYWPPSVAS